MYVSSYNTYINTNSSDRVQKNREEEERKSSSSSFASKLSTKPIQSLNTSSSLPINYISNYKVLHNQQKLYEETQENSKDKFAKINVLNNAKNTYSDSSKIFSFLIKPKTTLDQTPKIDKKMPQEFQEAKEKIIRNTMINTYRANDIFYKITA